MALRAGREGPSARLKIINQNEKGETPQNKKKKQKMAHGFSDEPIAACAACERFGLRVNDVLDQRRERGEDAVLFCYKCGSIDNAVRRFRVLKINRRWTVASSYPEHSLLAALRYFEDAYPEFRVFLLENPARLVFEKRGGLIKSAYKAV